MQCKACGNDDDELRYGVCFDCASKGEERAAKRRVYQHLWIGLKKLVQIHRWRSPGFRFGMKCDFKWALERLTKTGDYSSGGVFDSEGYNWR